MNNAQKCPKKNEIKGWADILVRSDFFCAVLMPFTTLSLTRTELRSPQIRPDIQIHHFYGITPQVPPRKPAC